MNSVSKENLKDLFEQFVGVEQAEEMAEDIEKGEQLLGEYSAPEPDDELISSMKGKVAVTLQLNKARTFRRRVYRAVGVAAVLIVVGAIGIRLTEKNGEITRVAAAIVPAAIWESDDVAVDDADLATLVAEIEEIESEALALQLGENGVSNGDTLLEVEMELIEINSDFWKG